MMLTNLETMVSPYLVKRLVRDVIYTHRKKKVSQARGCVRVSFCSPLKNVQKRHALLRVFKSQAINNTAAELKGPQYFLADFVDIQRKSFFTLLEKGLIEEFSKRNPITNTKKTLELSFYPEYYQLTRPAYTPSQAIVKSKSYTSRLYIPVQLTDKTVNTIKLKWVYIGNIPLMTKRGHFILNGCARVIVNQMIRSPGLYFQKKTYENYVDQWSEKPDTIFERYYADLICNRGTWLRIEIDKYNRIWAQMKRAPKIPIMWFLIAMGLPEKIILKVIEDSDMLLHNFEEDVRVPYKYKGEGDTHAPINPPPPFSSLRGGEGGGGPLLANKELPDYIKTPPAAWAAIYNLISPKNKKAKKSNNAIPKNKATLNASGLSKMPGRLIESESGRKWFFNKFMNPRTYDLGKVGRLNFNLKLNLSISANQTTLTPQDLLLATDYLIRLSKGLREVDDIDHLKNRRVRTSGELIQLQIGIGLVRLEKNIREKINRAELKKTDKIKRIAAPSHPPGGGYKGGFVALLATPQGDSGARQSFGKISSSGGGVPQVGELKLSPSGMVYSASRIYKQPTPSQPLFSHAGSTKSNIDYQYNISTMINTKPFNGALKEFFGSSPLSQFMDQMNPLAELTHKRRLSSMGPGGVTRDSATLEIRGIHPSHYGRICPVETPEGKNTGLVNSLTAYARVNQDGYIETPFYRVYKGQVQKKTGLYFFSAKQEEKIKLGAADLYTTDIGFLPLASIPVRIVEDFTKIPRSAIQYVGVAPIQMISIATSLIPFFEHDDGNRALMGSNMQRQAVPILKPQRPIVGTGLEARAVSDSGHVIQAKHSGIITYVSSNQIRIYCSV